MSREHPFTVMIVAGEASGDLHASHLVRALREREPSLVAFGFGGERMAREGVELAARLTDYQAVGYVEVLRSVPALAYHYLRARRLLAQRHPDALVVVDFPTFNLPLAEQASKLAIPVHYFIPPKVWGWKKQRARKVSRISSKIFTIFPFEPPYFKEHGGNAFYFGHPLIDFTRPAMAPADFFRAQGLDASRPLVTLLPGSRRQEIQMMLELYLEVARRLSDSGLVTQFAIPRAVTVPRPWLDKVLTLPRFSELTVRVVDEGIYDCLASSTLAIATCGTVTLEAAICNCPMVISYDSGLLTRWLFRSRHRFTHFGLPNIVAGREICPERVAEQAVPEVLFETAGSLLRDPQALAAQKRELASVTVQLGLPGVFARVAEEILRPKDGTLR